MRCSDQPLVVENSISSVQPAQPFGYDRAFASFVSQLQHHPGEHVPLTPKTPLQINCQRLVARQSFAALADAKKLRVRSDLELAGAARPRWAAAQARAQCI